MTAPVVRLSFRELHEPPPPTQGPGAFVHYNWRLPTPPRVGDRVLVPRGDAEVWAVVVGVEDLSAEEALHLESVTRLATTGERDRGRDASSSEGPGTR